MLAGGTTQVQPGETTYRVRQTNTLSCGYEPPTIHRLYADLGTPSMGPHHMCSHPSLEHCPRRGKGGIS